MQTQKALVTVILPTHNHAPFIAQAIESVLMQQTEFPFDILLHDDASTDGTADICREYAARYPEKITLIAQTVTPKTGRVSGSAPGLHALHRRRGSRGCE